MSAILDSPSAQRNKDPIWNVLYSKIVLPLKKLQRNDDKPLRALEVAAGCGVHAEHFAKQLVSQGQSVEWYPTDPEESSRASIQGRIAESNLGGTIQEPLPLTLHQGGIVEESTNEILKNKSMDWMLCINMIHISPWTATMGLMAVAHAKLRPGGFLYCYGPYKVEGGAVESNVRFDQSLKQRNPDWGVRDLEDVVHVANQHGLVLREKVEMPANNLSLIFQKQ